MFRTDKGSEYSKKIRLNYIQIDQPVIEKKEESKSETKAVVKTEAQPTPA